MHVYYRRPRFEEKAIFLASLFRVRKHFFRQLLIVIADCN